MSHCSLARQLKEVCVELLWLPASSVQRSWPRALHSDSEIMWLSGVFKKPLLSLWSIQL